MDLIEAVQTVVQRTVRDLDLSDLVIGTVASTNPLTIQEKNVSDPIPARALLLTAAVIEKKLSPLTGVTCYENGRALPREAGYVILNRGLAVGDRVLMLRVSGGQRYLVLSRVFGEGG